MSEIIFGFNGKTQFLISKDDGENVRSFDLEATTSFSGERTYAYLTDVEADYTLTSMVNAGTDTIFEYDAPDFGRVRVSIYQNKNQDWACVEW